jgi:hypothetical protein
VTLFPGDTIAPRVIEGRRENEPFQELGRYSIAQNQSDHVCKVKINNREKEVTQIQITLLRDGPLALDPLELYGVMDVQGLEEFELSSNRPGKRIVWQRLFSKKCQKESATAIASGVLETKRISDEESESES